MAGSENSLTGKWIGRYSYDAGGGTCSFEAWLDDGAGGLSGETVELNSFATDAGETLLAVVSGVRRDLGVTFTKTYTDTATDRIAYKRRISAGRQRISGAWQISGAPWCRGTFTPRRAPRVGQVRKLEMETT